MKGVKSEFMKLEELTALIEEAFASVELEYGVGLSSPRASTIGCWRLNVQNEGEGREERLAKDTAYQRLQV